LPILSPDTVKRSLRNRYAAGSARRENEMIAKFSISTLVGSLAFAAAAHAGPMEAPRSDVVDVSASVSVDGLELTTSKGAATALTRIKAAASQVCGAKPEPSQ
jgi:UrcA family protein